MHSLIILPGGIDAAATEQKDGPPVELKTKEFLVLASLVLAGPALAGVALSSTPRFAPATQTRQPNKRPA